MCHHYTRKEESTEKAEEEKPRFLNEESSVDTELVTDGGDGEEDGQ